jgi:RimJ/RimL family protein N-acetyltransferase
MIGKMDFLPLETKFRDIVLTWLEADHVKEFYYGDGLQNTLDNIDLYCQGINNNGDYSFDRWVAFIEDKPFGFLMTSTIEGPYDLHDDYNKWYMHGKRIFTLDLLIGSQEFLGKGLAHRMIQEFILNKFPNADFFLIDPENTNLKAIHVYEKAGFKKVGEFSPSHNPVPHVMMKMDVSNLKRLHL